MKKRILSVLIAVVLVLGMLPANIITATATATTVTVDTWDEPLTTGGYGFF